MGIISNMVGGTPLATSAMKGQKYAQEHPDDPAGGYGQKGIVGTLLKMFIGGAIGGALGGAGGAAGGAGGAAGGAAGGLGGLGGSILGGSNAIGGGLGEAGASLSQGIGGAGGGIMDQLGNTDWMGVAGDALQQSSGGHGTGIGSGGRAVQAPPADTKPGSVEDMIARLQSMSGNYQKNETGLMNIPGIPEYFKQRMSGW
jgi:hypothetical protein